MGSGTAGSNKTTGRSGCGVVNSGVDKEMAAIGVKNDNQCEHHNQCVVEITKCS